MKDDAHRIYHRYLVNRMADVLGLDLGLELDLTRISRSQYDHAIDRCGRCPDPEGCELWLEEHEAGAHEAPHLCRNKALLEHLRASY